MSGGGGSVGIVTVSAIPNLTGTSVNPLIRAATLVAEGWPTTLYLPWFAPADQQREYGRGFANPAAQAAAIAAWLPEGLRGCCPEIVFYPTRLSALTTVAHPAVPIGSVLRPHRVVVFEEIERHFFDGRRIDPAALGFRRRFPLVLGLLHTNQAAFGSVRRGPWFAPAATALTRLVARTTCHHSFSVASAAPCLRQPGEATAALNGVAPAFFAVPPGPTAGAYFIGKLIPEKGLHEAFRLLRRVGAAGIDLFGGGDLAYVRASAAAHGVAAGLRGGTAAPWRALAPYRVFVNCSLSEVLCTATAEALAMGKWVILPRHPSNRLFASFANCLAYDDDASFAAAWRRAMAEEPRRDPAAEERLSWAAAARRLARLIGDPPRRPHHDPPPYHAIPARQRREIRRWLARSGTGSGASVTGSHAGPQEAS